MRVLFIRHAESLNNILLAQLRQKMRDGSMDRAAVLAEFWATRSLDPAVSTQGLHESALLGAHIAPGLKETGAVIYVSGMERTTITALPLVETLRSLGTPPTVRVHPELHEEGGMFATNPTTGKHHVPEGIRSGDAIHKAYGWDTSLLPAGDVPWYTPPRANERETAEECVERARRFASWLRSDALQEEVGSRTLVLFSHQGFISMVLSVLLGAARVTTTQFLTGNTETSLLTVPAASTKDPVEFRWIANGEHLRRPFHSLSKL